MTPDRDHWSEEPAPWVAGTCDRGVRHSTNEDALALYADESSAALVVCDGVSSSQDSHVTSLAAARAARDVLAEALVRTPLPQTPASDDVAQTPEPAEDDVLMTALSEALTAANAAAMASSAEGTPNPGSCTIAAAVVHGHRIAFGTVGDSRVYWFGDDGRGGQLSLDDSVAQLQMEFGVPREQAETGPQAHAITRWLGHDAPDVSPRGVAFDAPGEGWLLVCSDGLWNYASEAAALAGVLESALRDADTLSQVTERLVAWANEQGGRDNITAAIARIAS